MERENSPRRMPPNTQQARQGLDYGATPDAMEAASDRTERQAAILQEGKRMEGREDGR